MTIGPDDRGNGPVTTQERFSPEPVDRYATPPSGYRTDGREGLGGREALVGREPLAGERMGGSGEQSRIGDLGRPGELGAHGDLGGHGEPEPDLGRRPSRNGGGLDLGGLTEPTFPPSGWLDPPDGPDGSLADHPLLRGLLLELPPKGNVPPQEWLDRWFEAARSILELLYLQGHGRSR